MIIYPNARRFSPGQGSLSFNGLTQSSNGLSVANSLVQFGTNPQSITMTAWMFLPFGTVQGGPWGPYTWFHHASSGTSGFRLTLDSGAPIQVNIYCDSGFVAGPALAYGWNFVAFVGNGSSFTCYTKSPSATLVSVGGTNTTNTGAGNTIVVGNSTSFNNALAMSYLSDLCIYSYPKTTDELIVESRQRQPVSKRGLKSYLPLRNIGSMQHDVFTGVQWTINNGRSNFLNSLQGVSVPEVANVRRARFLSHIVASQSHLYMTMGVGS